MRWTDGSADRSAQRRERVLRNDRSSGAELDFDIDGVLRAQQQRNRRLRKVEVGELETGARNTRDGRTARVLSENRPRSPVIAITPRPEVATRLALEWGVVPRLEIPPEDLEETDRKSTRLNSSHIPLSRMPSSA